MFPITSLYAALCGLLILDLSIIVVRFRLKKGVTLGDGGDEAGQRAIRAHANAVEYIPLALILMGLLEADHASAWALYLYGTVLFLGRLSHAWGLLSPLKPTNNFRKLGIIATWGMILVACVHLLVIVGFY